MLLKCAQITVKLRGPFVLNFLQQQLASDNFYLENYILRQSFKVYSIIQDKNYDFLNHSEQRK
jgi:hypothetical protein